MNALFSRIRLLPILIVLVVLLLSVKVGSLIGGFSKSMLSVSVATTVEAQQPSPVQPKAPEPAPAAAPPPAQPPAAEAPAAPEPAASSALSAQPALSGEPGNFTPAELEVLQKLAARRDVLEARAKEIQMREDIAKAAETRVNKKLQEMKQVQSTIEGLLKQYDAQQEEKMQSLVKIYESMKPKDAAKIFEELDMETLLSVVGRMKEKKVAEVLANMNPQKAKDITFALAEQRKLPRPDGGSGG